MNVIIRNHKKDIYFKPIVTLALPIIIQGFVIQFQTLINRAFLGNLKSKYLSTIGNIVFPFNATMSVLLAISTGVAITIAHKIGERKHDEIKYYFISALFFNTIIAFIIFIFWYVFCNKIYSLMGVDNSLIKYCVTYVRILEIYVITYGIDISIQSTLQGIGLTKVIMYSGLYKASLNILLDWILIFGNLGMPAMGINGAALSTAISNVSSTIFLILYIKLSKNFFFKIKLSEIFKPKFHLYKEMAKLGIPTGFETFVWYIGNLTLIKLLNNLSSIDVGIYTITYGIEVVIYVIYNGLGKSALTLIGHKKGEGNESESPKILSSCIKYDLTIIFIIFTIFVIFSKQILGIFTNDSIMIKRASSVFILTSATLFPKSLNVVVGNAIRSLGDTKWMLYTQIIGTVILIVIAYLTIFILKLNIIGIYITMFLDEFIRVILNLYHFYNHNRPEVVA